MAATTATALDLITGALRNINVQAAGEPLSANDAADALQVLNDLLDSLSTDDAFVVVSNENILAWKPGQYVYTIGSYIAGSFTGTVTVGSAIITGVTVPADLAVGSFIDDNTGAIPANATVTAIGAGTVTMSAVALLTPAGNPESISYTINGDFAIQRPMRIQSGYTRITSSGNTGLDYWYDVENIEDYNEIGYKGVPGPWPILVTYQQTYPLGIIRAYPNPTTAGELHFWSSAIFATFQTLTQAISLPQGYARAIKKLLALELAPEYGKNPSPELMRQAKEAREFIKNLNSAPVKKLSYDSILTSNRSNDASFIMHGGFN